MAGKKGKRTTAKTGQPSKRQTAPAGPKQTGISWPETVLFIVLVAAILCAVVFLAKPIAGKLQGQLGLDLRGGVHVLYKAVPSEGAPVTDDAIDKLIGVFRNRIDAYGLTEPLFQKQGSDRVVVELPGVKDPEEAIELLGRTAHMEFRTEDGETVLTGQHLEDAKAQLNPNKNQPFVALTFNDEGAKIFQEVTTANVGRRLAIYLDDNLITAPTINGPIAGGNAEISGGYQSLEEAQSEALLLRSGALPVNVELMEKRSIGPTLGQESLELSLKAGFIGIGAILIFMLLFYRWPGIIADLALIVFGLILVGIFILIDTTLTLPGIAGIILSIGMAVDSNIIIYERLKEELRAGKTLRSAIDAGFHNAFRAILDSNVTTLIAAAVLYFLGTGPIRGFAVTLSIGILVSMFTAIFFTRFVLHLVAKSRLVINPKAYGV
ncbi:MAG: protein translocase subunit SecD [Syntrophaceticus sp.]|nr:protein translocase subunit SecD [Syntrophaceticus sp.]MDD4359776.1 protein translocase subunit SecD [Syntrophaceticus sp.]MDD4782887.1 protein translocase subunit SecD [Syntrophaceticus sp.]